MLRNLRNTIRDSWRPIILRRGWECLLPGLRFFLTRRLKPFLTNDGYHIKTRQQLLCWWGIHIQDDLFRHWSVNPGELILDIGANYGVFGWECRRRFPLARIIAFEPCRDLANYCRALHRQGVRVYDDVVHCALAEKTGHTSLYVRSVEGSWTATIDNVQDFDWEPEAAQPTDIMLCRTERLDDWQFDPPALTKIDVDGGELRVLAGGKQTILSSRHILCELHPNHLQQFACTIGVSPIRLTDGDYLFTNNRRVTAHQAVF